MTWSGLLPLARLVESTPAEWIHILPEAVGAQDRDIHVAASRRIGTDRSLLSCLVDGWRPETHTFHFLCGEMAPTLQDVSYLLGLPLAGVPVGPLQAPNNWRNVMQARFAGVNPENPHLEDDAHGPRVSWLSKFQVRLVQFMRFICMEVQFVYAHFIFNVQCRLVF